MRNRSWRRLLVGIGLALVIGTAPVQAVAARDTTPPPVPANFRTVEVSWQWVRLGWNPSATAVKYRLELNGTQWETTGFETGFGRLTPGTTYQARVHAVDAAGNASAATAVTFTTLDRVGPPPAAPQNLRGVFVNGKLDRIAWDPSVYPLPLMYTIYNTGITYVDQTSSTFITVERLVNELCVGPGNIQLTVVAIGPDGFPSEQSAPLTINIPNP